MKVIIVTRSEKIAWCSQYIVRFLLGEEKGGNF